MNYQIQRLRSEMRRRGLDVFVAFQDTRYFTGTTAGKALIVPLSGEPVLLCSRLEQDQAKKGRVKDVRAYSGWKAPLRPGERVHFRDAWMIIADCVRDFGAHSVGYDRASKSLIRKIRNVRHASYSEMPELVPEARSVKSPEELKLARRSAEIVSKGMKRASELIEAGRTEIEIAAEAEYVMRKAGSEGVSFPSIVASGANSALPHAFATFKKLRSHELVVVDIGAVYEGYSSDMTRTFAIEPTKAQSRLLEAVKKAQAAGIARVKDGVPAREVDFAARNFVSRAGYSKFFSHGTGHGVGIEIHEPPSLWPESKDVLKANMVITVEPGAYVPKVGGARWEDMVLVKRGGREMLTYL